MGSKSAQKAVRASGRRQQRNRATRSQVKTEITQAEKLIAGGNVDEAKKAVAAAITALDKAAEKKMFHKNNTARRKSRLMKKLNKVAAQSEAKAAPEKAA